ncbi:MAG: PspC domain-containing protein [Sphaerochaetaceae bacterium]|jgi:phage shock protein C
MATEKLYRSRKGEIFGICQGIADWKELPVGTLRLIVAASIVLSGIFPGILIYAILALLIPLEPEYKSNNYSARSAFENLKRKVEDMEEKVFDKESDWDHRFHNR